MIAKILNIIFFILTCVSIVSAQRDTTVSSKVDTAKVAPNSMKSKAQGSADYKPVPKDTTKKVGFDTLRLTKNDTLRFNPQSDASKVRYSRDSLDTKVEYGAQDSMNFDNVNNLMHLYGAAFVNYRGLSLKAAYIVVDMKNNMAIARVSVDSLGQKLGKAEFSDGGQQFSADSMRYNFKTRKGLIYEVVTKQNDIFVHGSKTKFVSGAITSDSTRSNDIAYSQNAIFTTCNADHPHFGIHSTKQKVIPDKLIVVGPSNLVIGDVPTPLYLPFGFFPLTKGRRQGLIFPKDYEFSPQWGFGLRNIGYFVPLGEHLNLSVTGDVYWKGSWGVNVTSDYNKMYRYRGNLAVGYSDRRNENELAQRVSQKAWSFKWSYAQDVRAHPTRTFNSSINIQTNNFNSLNRNDARSVLENSLSSNANFTQSFPDKPFNLTASFTHSQNNRSREMLIGFPNVNFQMQRIFPFKQKDRIGKERWYEKVSFQYNSTAQNQFRTIDTLLFTNKTLQSAQFGIKHQASSDVSFRVLKYFNLSPSVNYSEVWYFKSLKKQFDPTAIITQDTVYNVDRTEFTLKDRVVSYGSLDTLYKYGFQPMRQFDASVNLNTQIFGTVRFKKGYIKGIRHVMKPNIGFGYSPDYKQWGYFDEVQTDSRIGKNDPRQYSIYEGGIFGTPSTSGKKMALTYSLNNIFEAKIRGRKDTIDRKIKLFDNILVNGNYNFAADSFRFSPVTVGGTLRLLKGLSQLNINASFDPYAMDSLGKRQKTLLWKAEKQLLRLDRASMTINTGLSFGELRNILNGKADANLGTARESNDADLDELPSFSAMFERFSLNHTFALQRSNVQGRDTITFTNSLNVRGSIPISRGWSIDVGNFGYDFDAKSLSYTDIGISRDLHCWEMGMRWQPDRSTYSFYIQVKPGSLDFLKVPYNKNNADSFSERF